MRNLWTISFEIYIVCVLTLADIVLSDLWVDGNKGDDSNPGSLDKPFKTIIKARDTIRAMKHSGPGLPVGNLTVYVLPGDYEFINGPLEFTAEDSGTTQTHLMYIGIPAVGHDDVRSTHLTAGVKFNWLEHITPVQDPVLKSLMKDDSKIVQINLKKLGITNYGDLGSGGAGGLTECANNKVELFSQSDAQKMILARYPNVNTESGQWEWLSISNVTEKQTTFTFNNNSTVSSKIVSWKNTSTLWLHGYWSYDWADSYVKVDSVSAIDFSFTVSDQTPPVIGFAAKARYYALNILEELDTENEYYIDRGSGILYLYETTARNLSAQNLGCISVGESVLLLDSVSYMTFAGFDIDCTRTTAVVATNVNEVTFVNLFIHDVGDSGMNITGYRNFLENITITRADCGGIYLSGGDQLSLTRGGNILVGSSLSNWSNWKRTYTPGLTWSGVGNQVVKNSFQNAPHAGIIGGGNDWLFENNLFDTLCYETSDAGAFYSGRSWIDRGNIVRGNTFRNIINTEKTSLGYPSVQAVYLDDQMSGYLVEDNTFINCQSGGLLGGGRRNIFRNNSCYNCDLCQYIDARGLGWMKSWCVPGGNFEQELQSVNYQHPPWSTHYPELVNIMNDHPCVPVYNVIEDNRCCKSKQFINVSDDDLKQWMITVKNNTVNC